MDLINRYKNLLTQGLSQVGQYLVAPRKASNLSPLIDTKQVANTRLVAGGPTVGEALTSSYKNNLLASMTRGDLFQNAPQINMAVNPVVLSAGQAAGGVLEGLTGGLLNLNLAAPTNRIEQGANLAGNIVGFTAPIGFGAKVLSPVGRGVETTLGKTLVSRRAGRLAQTALPVLAGEAAQTGTLALGSQLAGEQFNAGESLVYGLGTRGVLGTFGKVLGARGVNPQTAFSIDRGTIKQLEGVIDRIRSKKANDYDWRVFLDSIEDYAPGYSGKDTKTMLRALEAVIDRNTGGVSKENLAKFPKLGLVTDEPPKYAGNINTQRLQTSPQAKARVVQQVETLKPELEKIKGAPLTHEEVQQAAQTSNILSRVVTREQSQQTQAAILKARERLVTLDAEIQRAQNTGNTSQVTRLTRELVDTIKAVSSQAADAGRKLGSFRINAQERPFRDQIVEDILKRTQLSEQQIGELSRRIAQTDFNDARQVTALYRDYIKPSVTQMLDEYRYMNLLSSPKTHIVNAFSNVIQASVLNPATKLTSGIIDPVASAMTGKTREHYVMEIPHYYRGAIAAVPKAFGEAFNALRGKSPITNLDIDRLPSGSVVSKINFVTRALDASDRFFRTLIEGGEKEALGYKFAKSGAEASAEDIVQLASQRGNYYTFRQGLDTANAGGQGHLLSTIDKGTEWIMGIRKVPVLKWFVPFVQTPMNILKQGVEYSPAGFATLPGAADKTEQLAKASLGSLVFAGAGYLALQDRLTWASPKDNEQRKAFYAAGMQPYSIKIGDKWVSYSKLGPLAYPLAMAAAWKYATQDNPEAVTQGQLDQFGNAMGSIAGFFADQSYMQGIGDMVKAISGDEGYQNTFATAAGNLAGQVVPLSSLQRWIAQVVDPIYRKPDTFVERLEKDIPGMSQNVGFYENPLGEPSVRQFPGLNAFSPLSITQEKPEFKDLYDLRQQQLESNAMIRAEEKRLEQEVNRPVKANQAEAAGESGPTQDRIKQLKAEAAEKIARKRLEVHGGVQEVNDKVIYVNEKGETATLDFSQFKDSGLSTVERLEQEETKLSMARTIVGERSFSTEQRADYLKRLGISEQEATYDYYATRSQDIKSTLLGQLLTNQSHDAVIDTLIMGRRESVSGVRIVSDGVIDDLVGQELISTDEAKALKKVKVDKRGKQAPIKVSGGAKRKAVKVAIPKARKASSGGKSRLKIIRAPRYTIKPIKVSRTKLKRPTVG